MTNITSAPASSLAFLARSTVGVKHDQFVWPARPSGDSHMKSRIYRFQSVTQPV